jgi:membrane protease YdiL (CAAX protease family)
VPDVGLVTFVALTFLITWGTIGVYILWPEWATASFGEISGSHPAFFVATWGPAVAGFAVVLLHGGRRGVAPFLSRLLLWRCSLGWALFLAVGLPLVFVVGSLIKGGPILAPIASEGLGTVVGAALLMAFLGPVEEFGWRGVAQPILQRHVAPVWAGVLVGATWGLWHLPAFHLAGTVQSGWSFAPFFVGNVALAVLVTPLFNVGRGSILLPMVFHWQLINPVWPDAQPYDTWILVLLAGLVVGWKRAEMFSRRSGCTVVVPTVPRENDSGSAKGC